jgi:membrane-associated phospholipid phosphatase
MDRSSTQQPATRATGRTVGAVFQNMAVQDWITTAFHSYMLLRVLAAPDSADASFARKIAFVLLTATICTIVLVRGELIPKGRLRSLVYRLGLFTPVVVSYFEMRTLLPALQPVLLDSQLLSIDNAIFVLTPAVWLQRINSVPYVEWFSFFYYSYFYILTVILVPSLFLDRGRRLQELMIGAMAVACIGHVGYTLVLGLGPYATLAFDEPVNGGFWWGAVRYAVDGAGAMMDIFPSLHTAYPTFFALFAFGNRDRAPYKYAWPVLAFFAANIIVATMLLRWHYGIDVIFGLMLAITARSMSVWVAEREQDRGRQDDRQPVWEPLFPFQRAKRR